MKICRILKIIILVLFIIILESSNVYALKEIFDEAEGFITTGKQDLAIFSTTDTNILRTASSNIFNVLMAIGTGIAVIVGAILGIQFMTAGIDKKVEVKQVLFPYIISCVVMFGAFGIWKLVVTIMNSVV